MAKILETSAGIPMSLVVTHAGGKKGERGRSGIVTCPPDGSGVELSLRQIEILSRIQDKDFSPSRRGLIRNSRDRIAHDLDMRPSTLSATLDHAKTRHEVKTGRRPSTYELKELATHLGLLDPHTLKEIKDTVQTENITDRRTHPTS